ncbi:LmeA family phospholipid-binding protein [Streptomyces sp. SP18CS02]|uniref:LmeA family phospholipid-binding protein n=1 Tax=Streptomyces sp. SP18CS02 TaxID=3002531 RepID=UPI002E760F06|nr:DUF2993 domain-containing protein [Streptomyces sp. SP18CS02]MEE1755570.1 DUF2993 domain-containing protein [Streptomyces sp. SP18CS02]
MRALRILLITAVILGGLFVAVDRLAVNFAEDEAAQKVQAAQGLAGTTEVSIKGFPFLTQVLGKELDQVDIRLSGVDAVAGGRKVRLSEMNAALRDVRLEDNFSRAVAATASGTARVSYADLGRASGEDVTVGFGGNGKVKVTGTAEVLGKSITRSVLSTVSLVEGDTIRVRADSVPGEGIPGLEDMVRERTDFDRQVGGMPAGLRLTKVEALPDGIAITVGGQNVALAG